MALTTTLAEVMSFDGEGLALRCVSCNSLYEFSPFLLRCPRCGGLLEVVVEDPGVSWSTWKARNPGVWRYREALPVPQDIAPVSLGEGGTPIVEMEGLRAKVYIKFEGSNPTGSFKDRGMTVGVTMAKSVGARVVVAASTGNTAASMAAYAARAGLKAVVVLPRGGVARGKLLQAMLHGACIVEVEGSFDRAMDMVLGIAGSTAVAYPLNSFNPIRLEGQKTLAYEIVDSLGYVPDYVVVPVGNGGNIAAIWKGFRELWEWGLTDELPVMIGVQAEGASPLARAWSEGLREPLWIDHPRTIASAIRIGRPVNWPKAMAAVRDSGGLFVAVDDEAIMDAQKLVARKAGLGVEPSSAAAVAGLLRLVEDGAIEPDSSVVVVATGHALKDPDVLQGMASSHLRVSDASELERILEYIATHARG